MQDLRTAEMDFQKPINQLASEMAALKKQMAAKELSWEQEKQKMMKALKSERELRKLVQAGKKPREMVEVISSTSQSQNQDSPAEEVQVKEHQQTLSTLLQDLTTAHLDSQKTDNQLVSEMAALKDLMAAKELSWEQERQQILKALRSERVLRKIAQKKKNSTEKEMVEVISSPSQCTNQDSPAEEVQVIEHQQTLSTPLQDLTTAQPDSQQPDNQLASENAALKQQMAAKELSWEQEREKMMKALRSERALRKIAQADKNIPEKDTLIHSLRQSLLEKQDEIQLINSQRSAKFNQVEESLTENNTFRKNCVKKAYHVIFGMNKNNVMDLDAKMVVREKENVTALKIQEENCDKKIKQTVLDLESYTTRKDSDLIRSEAEWNIKLTALEDWMRCELAAKEESFQREQEQQRQSREMEEEEINLLRQQNADLQVHNLRLQELAQQTDKEKAQFKKEEKKARMEAEKILKKNRKEEEEREKNEKKENKKREMEELKRQKKERKDNDEREKEEVKRQKKEKKLMEKREKERK